MAEILHCICTTYFFICSSINGHLGYFHILAVVNSAAMNTFQIFPDVYPGVELLDIMIVLYSVFFFRNLHIIFQTVGTNLYSHQQWTSVSFSLCPLQYIICRLFDDSHSDRYRRSHCDFDLHFSNIVMLNIFSCAFICICHLRPLFHYWFSVWVISLLM